MHRKFIMTVMRCQIPDSVMSDASKTADMPFSDMHILSLEDKLATVLT